MKKYPKKTFTLKFSFSFALIVVALLIYSCRKEVHNQNVSKPNTVAVEMKNWLNSQKFDTLTKIAVNKYLNNIQWEQAVSITGDSSIVYDLVPVKIDTVAKFDDSQLTLNKYLVLTKVKGNVTGSALANVVGNKANTESFPALIVNFTHDKQGSFTGTISLGNITGVFKESKTYELGTMTRHSLLQTRDKSTNKTIQSTNGKVLHDCSAYYWVTYDQYGGTISEEYLFTVCDGNACNTTAIFGRKATLSLVLNCGGGGGGGGDGEPVVIAATIINNVTDPCLKTTLNTLINNNLSGKIANIINDVFNSSDRVNITFQQFDDPNAKPAKSEMPTYDIRNQIFNETINLNMAQIKDASMEFKTIIAVHEILHAYMNYNNQYFQQQFQQHKEIATKYVDDIRTFVQQIYPSMSSNDANAIILNGIADVYPKGIKDDAYLALLKSYGVTDALGNYELERGGITGTPCPK